jgi:hypothetical protein
MGVVAGPGLFGRAIDLLGPIAVVELAVVVEQLEHATSYRLKNRVESLS